MTDYKEYNAKLTHWRKLGNTMSHREFQIISDGSLIAEDSGIAFVTAEGEKHFIPIKGTQSINIYSNVVIEGNLLKYACENGISITVFDKLSRVVGRFVPETCSNDASTFLNQALLYADPSRRLEIARSFVIAECKMLRYVLQDQIDESITKSLPVLDKIVRQAQTVKTYDTLLLKEANARACYYSCFDTMITNSDFVFGKRSKRPPKNEVNALISFGNAVLYNHISNEIQKTSLDVRIGYLHATNRRSESLNLDIAEIFKPLLIDRLVFRLINDGMLKPDEFIRDEDSVLLNKTAKAIFIDAFNDVMNRPADAAFGGNSFRKLIQEEIRNFRKFVDGKGPYVPMCPRKEEFKLCS